MSLGTRIALIASSAVAVAVIAIAGTVYFTAQDRLVAEVDLSLTDRATAARAVGELTEVFDDVRGQGRGPGAFRPLRGFDVLYVQLVDPAGNTLIPPAQEFGLPVPDAIAEPGVVVHSEATVDGLHLRIASLSLGDEIGTFQIARSLEEVDATLSRLAVTLLIIGSLGVAGAAALGLFIARSSLRPIGDLTDAAERVAETKELAHRIDVERDDELGRLAEAFNEMLGALEHSKNQQDRLVRDAGHELRTPLTALRTNIELLARAQQLPDAERVAIYADLDSELSELTDLVNEVVEVATDPEATEAETTIDLGDLVESVVARYRRRTSQELVLSLNSPGELKGRATRLERAVSNLIDNAAKWSPPDSTITVTVADGTICVSDEGSGISMADRDRIFDRFYRSDEARSTPGSGLGLSIVKQVAENHGGTVFVEESAGGGARVGLSLSTIA
ncbi:MAG: HAMP domain-containing histidine kinase [Acidimicrobiia bacterium]|nr:HAMP domain-containing histidine kinase [Acidimicrobiia bacterium]